jgi:tetratricopeptide (TPR) repeat protein
LSVFRGGWTAEAAEAVCDEPNALQFLSELHDAALIVTETQNGAIRHRYLETIREYASEQLTAEARAQGETRHRAFFLTLAEEAAPQSRGAEQGRWLERLETEHDNLRTALAHCLTSGGEGAQEGLRLATSLQRFWEVRGYFSEGETRLSRLLASAGAQTRNRERAKALSAAGALAARQYEYARMKQRYEEALGIFRELGDKVGVASSLNNLASVARHRGDFAPARSLIEESVQICRETGNEMGLANSLSNLANLHLEQGRFAEAQTLYDEGRGICRGWGDGWGETIWLHFQSVAAREQGDYARATALAEEALRRRKELGDHWGIAHSVISLAFIALAQGDFARARAMSDEALYAFREMGDREGVAASLLHQALLAGEEGDDAQGETFCAEARRAFQDIGAGWGEAWAIGVGGRLARCRGDFAGARARLAESLTLQQRSGHWRHAAFSVEELALVFLAQGETEQGVRLWAAAQTWRKGASAPPPFGVSAADRAWDKARTALGADAFATLWAEGATLTHEQATEAVVSGLSHASVRGSVVGEGTGSME